MRTVNIGITDELSEKMDQFKDVNWSAVGRDCFEKYILQRSSGGLEAAISVIRSKMDKEYADGYEYLMKNIDSYSVAELERFIDSQPIEDEDISGLDDIRTNERYYDKLYKDLKSLVYSKELTSYDKTLISAGISSEEEVLEKKAYLSTVYIQGMMGAVKEVFKKSH